MRPRGVCDRRTPPSPVRISKRSRRGRSNGATTRAAPPHSGPLDTAHAARHPPRPARADSRFDRARPRAVPRRVGPRLDGCPRCQASFSRGRTHRPPIFLSPHPAPLPSPPLPIPIPPRPLPTNPPHSQRPLARDPLPRPVRTPPRQRKRH
ncbi:hypothetical protein ZWY2020_053729 [Hordeum vulgare]|nr:hypothetical protein ZWY2020_053729 [Hordeum vulgare]